MMLNFLKKHLFKVIIFLSYIFLFSPSTHGENNINKSQTENEFNSQSILNEDYYLLGPGDIIFINFLGAPEYSKEFELLNDGKIYLPFNKNAIIYGKNLKKASEIIEQSLSMDFINPAVEIRLIQRRPIRVTVRGEIKFEGIYTLDNNQEIEGFGNNKLLLSKYPTLVEALQVAGGITNKSDTNNIKLIRKIDENEFKETKLDLSKFMQEGEQINNPFLLDGDIIFIPKTSNKMNDLIGTNLVQNKVKVYVVGEVKKPGEYFIPKKTTLDQAILIAGGPLKNRSKSSIYVSSSNSSGENSIRRYRYNKKFLSQSPVKVKDGDILYLETNLFGRGSDLINDIAKPADGILRTFTLIKLLEN